ncbi:MAG TPA: rhodanese-like domain-containing protein [Pyrinomonadaceae bacterium]|nr:rhodanese-like domain-containing protein [Pyrinomonadaceae bacterium]
MRFLTFSITGLALAALLTACDLMHSDGNRQAQNTNTTPTVTSTPYPDGARRITIKELESLMKDGKVFIVDVRNQDSFNEGHIPGSKLIPTGEILNHVQELPRDKLIVTYCS